MLNYVELFWLLFVFLLFIILKFLTIFFLFSFSLFAQKIFAEIKTFRLGRRNFMLLCFWFIFDCFMAGWSAGESLRRKHKEIYHFNTIPSRLRERKKWIYISTTTASVLLMKLAVFSCSFWELCQCLFFILHQIFLRFLPIVFCETKFKCRKISMWCEVPSKNDDVS